jgi:polar amino acid transport system substrate-binding protein
MKLNCIRTAFLFGSVIMTMATGSASADDSAVIKELAPTGKLRVAIAVGPAPSALWTVRDAASGKARGVPVTLGTALAQKLKVPVEMVEHKASGEIIDATNANTWDVTFVPVDDDRKKVVDFGPNYSLGESTYLVSAASNIKTMADIDKPGVRIVGVDNTTTIRASRRITKNATVIGTNGLDEAVQLFRDGKVDAVALGRDSLEDFAQQIPGSHVLAEHFWAVGTAVAVPKGKSAALAYVSEFIEQAKADGTVKRAFEANGLKNATVAPAGSRS